MEERLQKILSRTGVTSRRKAEEMIQEGRVSVNGTVLTELGSKADLEKDHIKVDGTLLHSPRKHVYIMLNKPREVVTTVSDPEGRQTVMHLLRGIKERLFPVGRLDYSSEGLLLFTNDGEFAHRITAPASHLMKTYVVKVTGNLTEDQVKAFANGVPLGGRKTAPAQIKLIKTGENPWYEVKLSEGRQNQIRMMFKHFGKLVEKLRRVKVGFLELDVAPGRYRSLTTREIEKFRHVLKLDTEPEPQRPEPKTEPEESAEAKFLKPAIKASAKKYRPKPRQQPEQEQEQEESFGEEESFDDETPKVVTLRPAAVREQKPAGFRPARPGFSKARPAAGGDRPNFSKERPAGGRGGRPEGGDRPKFAAGGRGPRPVGGDRKPGGFGGDRPKFAGGRGPRPEGGDRKPGGFGGDRPKFAGGRGPRPEGGGKPGGFGGDRPKFVGGRGPRPEGGDRKPGGFGGDRPKFAGGRGPRPEGGGRKPGGFGADRPKFAGGRGSRPEGGDRKPGGFGGDRPKFAGGRGSRPEGGDRPKFSGGRPPSGRGGPKPEGGRPKSGPRPGPGSKGKPPRSGGGRPRGDR